MNPCIISGQLTDPGVKRAHHGKHPFGSLINILTCAELSGSGCRVHDSPKEPLAMPGGNGGERIWEGRRNLRRAWRFPAVRFLTFGVGFSWFSGSFRVTQLQVQLLAGDLRTAKRTSFKRVVRMLRRWALRFCP